jgi:hypothetical protein
MFVHRQSSTKNRYRHLIDHSSQDVNMTTMEIATEPGTCSVKSSLAEGNGSMTIKQILAQLGGVFPMDEAVVEGE